MRLRRGLWWAAEDIFGPEGIALRQVQSNFDPIADIDILGPIADMDILSVRLPLPCG